MTDPKWLQLITDRRQTGPVELPKDTSVRLPALSGIRAVVFDVYGTLFSSGVGDISLATEENRDSAIRAVLAENGIRVTRAAAKLRIDKTLHTIIHNHQSRRRARSIEYPEVDIRSVWAELITELATSGQIETDAAIDIDTLVIDYETRVNPTQPMPGLAELLTELHANGLTLSIISNAQFYTPLLFEAFLRQSIDELGFCPDCNAWSYEELVGKPSQQLYRLAAERLKQHHQLTPDQCLYIGNDMRNDIWPAQAIGFQTALFAGDRLSLRRREAHPNYPDQVAEAEITELGQVGKLIGMR